VCVCAQMSMYMSIYMSIHFLLCVSLDFFTYLEIHI